VSDRGQRPDHREARAAPAAQDRARSATPAPGEMPVPPLAERRPHVVERHGRRYEDPWHWLRDRDDPAVRAHLGAENAYTASVMAPLEGLTDRIYDEFRGRVQQTDASAPVLDGGWLYYDRTVEGLQYPIHCRRPAPPGVADPRELPDHLRRPVDAERPPEDEVVLLDENTEGHEYFRLGGLTVSPDHRLAAELVDVTGDEVFLVRVRDLATGRLLDDEIPRAGYGIAWFDDSATFLYTVPDEAWRPYQVRRHRLGTADDEVVLEEEDERFWIGIGRTRSERFLAIEAACAVR